MPFRIGSQGSTEGIIQLLNEQFGFDLNTIGYATPEAANQLRLNANAMKAQVEMSKSIVQSVRMIADCYAQIEELRKEAIEASMKRREEIEKMVSQLEIAVARHEQTLKKIAQDTNHGIRLAQRKGRLDLASGNNRLKLELQALRRKATAQMRVDREISRQKVSAEVERIQQQPAEAQARSQDRRDFSDYINGRSTSYQPRAGSAVNAFFN